MADENELKEPKVENSKRKIRNQSRDLLNYSRYNNTHCPCFSLFMRHRMCTYAIQHVLCVCSLAVWNSDEEDSAESSTDDEATEERPVAETPDEK